MHKSKTLKANWHRCSEEYRLSSSFELVPSRYGGLLRCLVVATALHLNPTPARTLAEPCRVQCCLKPNPWSKFRWGLMPGRNRAVGIVASDLSPRR